MNYYQVDRKKWQKLDIFNQMGNISSEVGRSFIYLKRNDRKMADAALVRALDLFDATIEALIKTHSPKSKEVIRAREEYLHAFYDNKDPEGLENYFNQFAVAARLHR